MEPPAFSGTFTAEQGTHTAVLTLTQAPSGTVRGRLAGYGGGTFDLRGLRQGAGMQGTLDDAATGRRFSFEAKGQDDHLQFLLFPLDADGNLDFQALQSLRFERQAPAACIAPVRPPRAVPEAPPAAERAVVINRQRLTPERLQRIEFYLGATIPSGRYWYDGYCGAWGVEGGPPAGFLAPRLDLPGPVPEDASGGGTGRFANGREMHPKEVRVLVACLGGAPPGRYWLDALGNLGLERGPFLMNLLTAHFSARDSGAPGFFAKSSGASSRAGRSQERTGTYEAAPASPVWTAPFRS